MLVTILTSRGYTEGGRLHNRRRSREFEACRHDTPPLPSITLIICYFIISLSHIGREHFPHLDLHLLTNPLVGGGDAGVLEVGSLPLDHPRHYLTCFKLLHIKASTLATSLKKTAYILCTECSQMFKKLSRQNSKSKTFSAADFPRLLSKSH